MRGSRRTVVLLAVIWLVAGCTDATAPGSVTPAAQVIDREPTAEELEGLPPEFAFPTIVYGYRIEGGYHSGGRVAWAHAILDYFATDAVNTIELTLFKGGTMIGVPRSNTATDSETIPLRRRSVAGITAGVPEACGYRHDANGEYSVFNSAVVGPGQTLRWQTKGNGASASFSQEPCGCDTGPGGGYGGENGEMATSITPTEVRLECSNPPPTSTGGGGSGSTGGAWYEVKTTTCFGFLHLDSNGNVIHATVHGCVETKSYYFAAA